jgi:hypothetical protein
VNRSLTNYAEYNQAGFFMSYVGPRGATYALAALFALALACDLLWMPVQVSDSLGEILEARQSPSVWASFTDTLGSEAYLRPLRIAQIKALYDLAEGRHYWAVYRGFHALLIVAAILLFTRALRVRTAIDFAAAAVALTVLIGLHTFRGTVQEAFPINHFLEIAVLCLVVLNLAQSRGGVWVDVGAALTFAVGALTLESGLLVWFVAVAAWAAGWRGISVRALSVMTVLLLGYGYLRFVHLATGVPSLTERSSGYLPEVLDPDELERRFGSQPLWFYAYNVLASAGSVLFAEPRSGVFETVSAWLNDRPLRRELLLVATSIVTTGLIAWTAVIHIVRRRPMGDTARFIVVFVVVLAANAMLSFAYTKDEIMSVAGVFYALAAFGAIRHLATSTRLRVATAAAGVLLVGVLATGWSVRAAGVHYVLRSQAIKHQIDWVELLGRWHRENRWPTDAAEERLLLRLHADAVHIKLPNTRIGRPDWPNRLWIE